MGKVLVTGATGFVGKYLCSVLVSDGHDVLGASRFVSRVADAAGYDLVSTGDIGEGADWKPVIGGFECVVHLAARVHVMNEKARDPLAEFRRTNVGGTEKLLRDCGARGVKRFIYLSTVKVCGERTTTEPLGVTDAPMPHDPYARSKLEAEKIVEKIGAELGVETVIIRPPLVYGPGVGGNFLRLLKLVEKGIPLPFASIENQRSLVGVSNLCDLIRECLDHASAAGNIFMVSDNNDLSTPALIRHLAAAMDRRPRIFPFPIRWLQSVAKLSGKSAEASRLIDSLQIDVSRTMDILGWSPPVSVSDEIRSTVNWLEERKRRAAI